MSKHWVMDAPTIVRLCVLVPTIIIVVICWIIRLQDHRERWRKKPKDSHDI